MKISAYRNDEKNGITNSIDIEYNAESEAECREAFMRLMPYLPLIVPTANNKHNSRAKEDDELALARLLSELLKWPVNKGNVE